MPAIPHDIRFDSTLALLREGYNFIPNRCRVLSTDIFEARVMLKKTIFIHGAEAAALFYGNERFMRHGAIPKRIQKTLFGERGVLTLDGETHRRRKALFLALMGEQNLQMLSRRLRAYWQAYTLQWKKQKRIVFFHEARKILFQTICDWAGIPYGLNEVSDRACYLAEMIDAFGGVGLRHWRGRIARWRMERWMEDKVALARSGTRSIPENSALHLFALHREPDGKMLDKNLAAVELLNVVRPAVALAYYMCFAAHALHQHPECREKLLHDPDYSYLFTQEVRRFYPFAPFLGALTRMEFEWKDYVFPKGRLVILDLYGTNHDPRQWEMPDQFMPERFLHWHEDPFNFIPSGGGYADTGHRCPGEGITVEALITLTPLLAALHYALPSQDLAIDLSRLPTVPRSGVIMEDVRGTDRIYP